MQVLPVWQCAGNASLAAQSASSDMVQLCAEPYAIAGGTPPCSEIYYVYLQVSTHQSVQLRTGTGQLPAVLCCHGLAL